MIHYLLDEDEKPQKLPVIFTDYVTNQIEETINYNRGNIYGISALGNYIDWITNHVSNRAIAFDYGGKFARNSDGMTIIYDKGICFYLIDDSEKVFVEIVAIDLNLEEFGLKTPSLNESKNIKKRKIHYIKESQLRQIIREVIYRIKE